MNDENEAVAARFVALETKVAYQDKLIADLNEVIVERGRELDALAKRLAALERLVRDAHGEPTPPQEPPPHY